MNDIDPYLAKGAKDREEEIEREKDSWKDKSKVLLWVMIVLWLFFLGMFFWVITLFGRAWRSFKVMP